MASAKSIGDEPLRPVPEFPSGFRGDVLAVGPPPAGAAGAAPPAGGDPAGPGAAAAEEGPPCRWWAARGETSPRCEWRGGQGRLGWAERLRVRLPAAIAGLSVVQGSDLAFGNGSIPALNLPSYHVQVSGSFWAEASSTCGRAMGHGRESFRSGVIGRCGGNSGS